MQLHRASASSSGERLSTPAGTRSQCAHERKVLLLRARASRPYQRFLWVGHGLLPGGHPVDDDAWSMSATSCCVARHAELP